MTYHMCMGKQRKIDIKGESHVIFKEKERVLVIEEWQDEPQYPVLNLSENEAIMLSIYLQEIALEDD